jgi:type IV secretion system protein VirD4
MKKPVNIKKIILPNLPYLLFALLGTKCGQAARLAPGLDFSQKALHILDGFRLAFKSLLPSFHPADLLVGLLIAAALRLAVYVKGKNAKKFRKNMEYGSARWGTHEDIAPYIDPVFENNIILTQTESLTMNNRPKDPRTARNKNVLVIGGSGSGKTRFFIKPNLMQCQSKDYPVSFVVTDPKGSIVVECGKLLEKNNYRIKIFNTINFSKSMHYNPFAYIHSEKDILKLVNTLICNTKGDGKSGDDFWVKAETLLYCALIGYIHYEAPEEEQNFATLIELVNAMEVREDDETFENPVDIAFKELEKNKPNHFAVRQYKKYKLAAGKTAKSINISCGARLAPFDIAELREITMYDELELDTLGDKIYDNPDAKDGSFKKTALFLIMSDTDSTFNFLISMIYSQLFNLLCEKADDQYKGRLPVHVRCLIDEAANIGQIPNLEKLMATIRSREISACLVLQAQSQLKALYKDNADTIIGNCDTSIFLGGKEPTTLKELNQALGKETIDTFNTGESRGREVSHSLNYQKLGKDLATVDELAVLDGSKCILQLRGVRPFLSNKFDITQHRNYKYLSDANPKNEFDIEKFLSHRLKPKQDEAYNVFEVDVSEADEAAGEQHAFS